MVNYCCVPQCKNNAAMKGIALHRFPNDEKTKREWIIKIRRDERRNRKVSNTMRVCSAHFIASDYEVMEPRKILNKGVVPSVFAFSTMRKKPRRILNRTGVSDLLIVEQACGESSAQTVEIPDECLEDVPIQSNSTSSEDNKVKELENRLVEAEKMLQIYDNEIRYLNSEVDNLKKKLAEVQSRLKSVEEKLKSTSDFSMEKLKSDQQMLTYYTGYENLGLYEALREYINPGNKNSYSKKLCEEDQHLLVLCKLRQGFENIDLAYRFNISQKTVAKIFIAWLNIYYCRLGFLNIWPKRGVLLGNAPQEFLKKFPTTYIILDGTEIKIETPSSLVTQSQSFSSYKSSNTAKGLIGCDPKGGIIFISQLFTGSISDKQISQDSGLYDVLKKKLQEGEIIVDDGIMVDKGFNIKGELESLRLKLNIPPMASSVQFTEEEVHNTRKIASHRIHVERAIRRVKAFKVLQGTIRISMLPYLNQIWTVCCVLANFRSSLNIEEQDSMNV